MMIGSFIAEIKTGNEDIDDMKPILLSESGYLRQKDQQRCYLMAIGILDECR